MSTITPFTTDTPVETNTPHLEEPIETAKDNLCALLTLHRALKAANDLGLYDTQQKRAHTAFARLAEEAYDAICAVGRTLHAGPVRQQADVSDAPFFWRVVLQEPTENE